MTINIYSIWKRRISRLAETIPPAAEISGGYYSLFSATWRVWRREGIPGVRYRASAVWKNSKNNRIESKNIIHANNVEKIIDFSLNIRNDEVAAHDKAVDIVICVHNALEDTKKCLNSLFRNTNVPYRLIIVNDGSGVETTEYLEKLQRDPMVVLLKNDIAQGYTFAANQGLCFSDADFVVLLNSDTVVPPKWLDRLVECMNSSSRVGMAGPLSNTASWQSVPSIFNGEGDWADNSLPDGMDVAAMSNLVAAASSRAYPEVGFLNGFCLIIRRELIEDIGIFDEENFGRGYGEENDFSLRATSAGWKLLVADDCYVYHAQSKSYSTQRRTELVRQSDAILRAKHGVAIDSNLFITKENLGLASARARVEASIERANIQEDIRKKYEGKRILFVLPARDAGGGANVVITEAKAMRRAGVDAQILNLQEHKLKFESDYHYLDVPVNYVESPSQIPIISSDFDALVATVYFSMNWIREYHRSISCRIGYYIQDFEPSFFEEDSANYRSALSSYDLPANFLSFTKTRWNAEELYNGVGLDAAIVGASFDWDGFAPMAKNSARLEVSAMIRPSTPRRAPEATAMLMERLSHLGDGVHLHIFGGAPTDPILQPLSELPNVTVHGHLTPRGISQLLARMDLFVDMSVYQAMGLTAIEAMASGASVIGPKRGGLGEIITDGVDGLLVDTSDLDACYAAVIRFYEDREFLRRAQMAAVSSAAQLFPEKAALKVLDKLFQ